MKNILNLTRKEQLEFDEKLSNLYFNEPDTYKKAMEIQDALMMSGLWKGSIATTVIISEAIKGTYKYKGEKK